MNANERTLGGPAQTVPRPGTWWPGVVLLGIGSCVAGLGLIALAHADATWAAYLAAGAAVGLAATVFGINPTLLVGFGVALSLDAHYYITQPIARLYTGMTSPGALSIPLALVPGLVLLGMRVLLWRQGASDLRGNRAFIRATLLVIGTASLAMLAAPMRFVGLCVVWQLGCLLLLFIVVVNEVRTPRQRDLLVAGLMLALFGQCVVFGLQLGLGVKFTAVGGGVRSDSMWHAASGTAAITTAGFATYLEPLVALAYARYRTSRGARTRLVYGLLAAAGAVVVVLTLNRSSLVGLPLTLGVVEVLLRRRRVVVRDAFAERRMIVAACIAAVVLSVGLVLVQSKRSSSFWSDLQQRFDLAKPGFSMIASHPLLGVGPGVYAYRLREYAGDYRGWLYISHNDYLLIGAERGIVGLAAFLLWIRTLYALLLRQRPPDGPGVVPAIAAAGGFSGHLWEIFWTAGMSFPAYGIVYVLMGLVVAADRLSERKGRTTHAG